MKLRDDLELRIIGEEALLYDKGQKKVHLLNGTATIVFNLLNDGELLDNIIEHFVSQYQIGNYEAKQDIDNIVCKFRELNLVCS